MEFGELISYAEIMEDDRVLWKWFHWFIIKVTWFQLSLELIWGRYTFVIIPAHSYSFKCPFAGGYKAAVWLWWGLLWSLFSPPFFLFYSMSCFSFSLSSHFSKFFHLCFIFFFLQSLNVGVSWAPCWALLPSLSSLEIPSCPPDSVLY